MLCRIWFDLFGLRWLMFFYVLLYSVTCLFYWFWAIMLCFVYMGNVILFVMVLTVTICFWVLICMFWNFLLCRPLYLLFEVGVSLYGICYFGELG